MDFQPEELKSSILSLLKLQEIDGMLFRLSEEVSKPSSERLKTEALLKETENDYRSAEKGFKDFDRERRSLELRNITLQEALRRAETKRKEVRNTKEEFAANKEYEGFQRKFQEADKSLKERQAQAQLRQDGVNSSKVKFDEISEKLEELKVVSTTRAAEVANERSDLVAKREAHISRVNPTIFSMYERVQKTRRGTGVAVVRGGSCTGCFVAIPPQQKSKLLQLQSLMTCPSCSRILFPEQLLGTDGDGSTPRQDMPQQIKIEI